MNPTTLTSYFIHCRPRRDGFDFTVQTGRGDFRYSHNPAVFKISLIMIGDFPVFYLSGMKHKQDAETVKVFI
jgi:hypothetical protein